MKMKKLLILTAAGLASSVVLAGNSMYAPRPAPAPMMMSDTGIYIEGMAGYNRYAFTDGYDSSIRVIVPSVESYDWDNGTGNWAFAAAIGYQFHRYFSAELGGIYTLRAKFNYTFHGVSPAEVSNIKVQPWYAYLAGKMSIPIYDNLSLFAKLGAGYQKVKMDDASTLGTQNNWGPMFGAGLAYNFTPAFYITGQWLRFTGKIKDGVVQTTAPNIFLIGLGYKFAM